MPWNINEYAAVQLPLTVPNKMYVKVRTTVRTGLCVVVVVVHCDVAAVIGAEKTIVISKIETNA